MGVPEMILADHLFLFTLTPPPPKNPSFPRDGAGGSKTDKARELILLTLAEPVSEAMYCILLYIATKP